MRALLVSLALLAVVTDSSTRVLAVVVRADTAWVSVNRETIRIERRAGVWVRPLPQPQRHR
jgi:hypothetical protein